MKHALGWVKANLITVIAIVVALGAFPTLFVLSRGRQATLEQKVEREVGQSLRDLNQISVTYEAPSLDPSAAPISISMTPNAAINQTLASWIDAINAEADRLFDFVVTLNGRGRAPLVDGLFPEPSALDSTSKRLEMARRWPAAIRSLVERVGAGSPPTATAIYEQLRSRYDSERQRILGIGADETVALSPEDAARISATLGAERLAAYRRRADEVRFYARPDAIQGVEAWDEVRGAPPLEQCWEWQWRTWIVDDVVAALAAANTDQAGQAYSASTGPIKRLEALDVPEWDLPAAVSGARGAAPATPDLAAPIPRDYEISPTGRAGWPDNPGSFYDVRYADLSLIVDSSRITQVLDAFPRTGLMTVVSLNIEEYDPLADVAQGYYYGESHLVRLTIRVETVWIRTWMAPMIPDSIRALLGVPESWAHPEPAAGSTRDEAPS